MESFYIRIVIKKFIHEEIDLDFELTHTIEYIIMKMNQINEYAQTRQTITIDGSDMLVNLKSVIELHLQHLILFLELKLLI